MSKAPEPNLIELHHDFETGGTICLHRDGRMFVTLGEHIRYYALHDDETALPAFNRAFTAKPELYREIHKKASVDVGNDVGFSGQLTDVDRARLTKIILKHHQQYFADHPTPAQIDNLINGLGIEVATRLIKTAVDNGAL